MANQTPREAAAAAAAKSAAADKAESIAEANSRAADEAANAADDAADAEDDRKFGDSPFDPSLDPRADSSTGRARTAAERTAAERSAAERSRVAANQPNKRGVVRTPPEVVTAADRARERAAIDGGILLSAAEDKANARPTPEARRLGLSQADEIADLKARLAELADLVAGAHPTETISAAAVAEIVQPYHPITDGGTERPEEGPLHLTTGAPIFNPARPTGRAG